MTDITHESFVDFDHVRLKNDQTFQAATAKPHIVDRHTNLSFFEFLDHPTQIGRIAQDLLLTHLNAVSATKTCRRKKF